MIIFIEEKSKVTKADTRQNDVPLKNIGESFTVTCIKYLQDISAE